MSRAPTGSVLNGMDLLTLRLLLAAREEGNLARAAERENIAVSAVSRRISDFESRYGVRLLDRHDRGVSVTPDGAAMLDRVAHAVELLEQIARDLQEIREGVRGNVRLRAHTTAILSGSLPARMADFLERYPRVEVELDEGTSFDIIHAVRVGVCDLGLISGTVASEGVELIPWMDDELVAVLPAGHPLAAKEALSLSDLVTEPFVGMQRDSSLLALYRTQAQTSGQTLHERVHATSFESVRSMVAAGVGVGILPAVACVPAAQGRIAFRRLDEPWAHRPLMLCVRDRQALSAAAKLLARHLMPEGQEHRFPAP
ncbi:DNA-binding transcriptional LysR family regulator [Hephaestia caeni]|uniref:DNA-binding transcriptional LysR family regulator n=1 Tax=Hephaestia caeni TaxID=645617 RepID=A0A397NQH9_9SPHN|nr:LysR family transcriptional regulator [Hephaestia caeni]RIA37953.1 DNA-binding transcriptional LysR family regulator [Hephaestia caeni]